MRTQEELQNAVKLSLDDDNKRTALTIQLYQIINFREYCTSISDYERRLREMYTENELCYSEYSKQRKELKDMRLKGLSSEIDYDAKMSDCNYHLRISRMRRKVLGFIFGDVSIEELIGLKKHSKSTSNNII